MLQPKTLRTRISLLLTAVAAALLVALGSVWLDATRKAIHEEVEAATRVAEQWLTVLLRETARDPSPQARARLMGHLESVGRLRANTLRVETRQGALIYHSPEPTYKRGRDAPGWFAALVSPRVSDRVLPAGELQLRLLPDTSRATLDAWDELCLALGGGVMFLGCLFTFARFAMNRALAPLCAIDAALALTARGEFNTRLPHFGAAELDRVATTYNRMASTLESTLVENSRLAYDQAFAEALQSKLEAERLHIARELHDELGQGTTAVRTLAGAIRQRIDDPQLVRCTDAILSTTSDMQSGVRRILRRLRPVEQFSRGSMAEALATYCKAWAARHPEIHLEARFEAPDAPIDEQAALALFRLLQESLTNVARHAAASAVTVRLEPADDGLQLSVTDNGRGLGASSPAAGHFGIAGMRERVLALHGSLSLERPEHGGLRVRAELPFQTA